MLGALAAVALSAGPSAAEDGRERARAAACGGTVHYAPSARRAPGRPPLAIGDSVMLGAVPQLRGAGFEVDVRGCRQFAEGLSVLAARARAGTLPDRVVIALGTNWTIETPQVRRALITLGRERVLGLMTPREVGGASSTDQTVVRAAGSRWPARVKVLDWVSHSAGHSNWFYGDGLHLSPAGARGLARLARDVFAVALPGEAAPEQETEPAPEPPGQAPGGGTVAP